MKFLIAFSVYAFVVFAQAKSDQPFISMDDFQVKSDGTLFVDESKWKPQKTKPTDETTTFTRGASTGMHKISVRKTTALQSVTTILGLTGEKEYRMFSQAVDLKFREGAVDVVTSCFDFSGCLSINKNICDEYAKSLGMTGKQINDLEKSCSDLGKAKESLKKTIHAFPSSETKDAQNRIQKLSGTSSLKSVQHSIFNETGVPSIYAESISGYCWNYFWSREDAPTTSTAPSATPPESGSP